MSQEEPPIYLLPLTSIHMLTLNITMSKICEMHHLILSRSMTFAEVSKSTMSHLFYPNTRDNLDINIIINDINLIIMTHHDFLHTILFMLDFIKLV